MSVPAWTTRRDGRFLYGRLALPGFPLIDWRAEQLGDRFDLDFAVDEDAAPRLVELAGTEVHRRAVEAVRRELEAVTGIQCEQVDELKDFASRVDA